MRGGNSEQYVCVTIPPLDGTMVGRGEAMTEEVEPGLVVEEVGLELGLVVEGVGVGSEGQEKIIQITCILTESVRTITV